MTRADRIAHLLADLRTLPEPDPDDLQHDYGRHQLEREREYLRQASELVRLLLEDVAELEAAESVAALEAM